ncbi:MAG: acyl-CoA reductase [Longimicrobiales bacterium]
MSTFDAFHLPGLPLGSHTRFGNIEPDAGSPVRYPQLEAVQVSDVARTLRGEPRAALLAASNEAIIGAIDRAAQALTASGPARLEAERWMAATSGLSGAMASAVLDGMAREWRREALERLLEADLADPLVLERFRHEPHSRRMVRALGPGLALHILAGNVPGVGVTSMTRSLLARSPALVKTGAGDPVLPTLFARALAAVEPRFGAACAVTYWPGGAVPEDAAIAAADLIVVYGGESVVTAVRRLAPPNTRVVVHGPKLSIALIAREALGPESASATLAAAARATALFDQQGCVSPHAIYVERDAPLSGEAFAQQLAAAMARLEKALPRGRLRAEDAAQIRQLRAATEFAAIAGRPLRLFAPETLAYTVILDEEPALEPSCLNRTVRVKPVPRLEDAIDTLAELGPLLQAVGIAGPLARRQGLAERLAGIGAARITSLEALPWPPSHGHHDGGGPLAELLRWVDLELSV